MKALLSSQLSAVLEGSPHWMTALANASAVLYEGVELLNWAGFYLLEGEDLILGPFQGKAACIRIPKGKGVCGAAVERNESVLVPDVHSFPGHIACDSASRSELVIPLRTSSGRVFGVLDMDSPYPARFTAADRSAMEECARVIEKALEELNIPF